MLIQILGLDLRVPGFHIKGRTGECGQIVGALWIETRVAKFAEELASEDWILDVAMQDNVNENL